MTLQDALFNWAQIRLVADARPDDHAAAETVDFFAEILQEDHQVTSFGLVVVDEEIIRLDYTHEGVSKSQPYDRDRVERLLADIRSNPKYNEQ
ncbi:hypothetical protein [Paenibacillus lutrae]|uniref:Uncharacterized protein n=1 Tax=Paenibacillus lutrae TaxID=2078573 RepID=A0A7X3JYQ3_9BACL|nr:hypothetical protein [Paenibacillus lutrae]